jgi:hypothetical protein
VRSIDNLIAWLIGKFLQAIVAPDMASNPAEDLSFISDPLVDIFDNSFGSPVACRVQIFIQ